MPHLTADQHPGLRDDRWIPMVRVREGGEVAVEWFANPIAAPMVMFAHVRALDRDDD